MYKDAVYRFYKALRCWTSNGGDDSVEACNTLLSALGLGLGLDVIAVDESDYIRHHAGFAEMYAAVLSSGWALADACQSAMDADSEDRRPFLCARAIEGMVSQLSHDNVMDGILAFIHRAGDTNDSFADALHISQWASYLIMIAMRCSKHISPAFTEYATTEWNVRMLTPVPRPHARAVAVECLVILLNDFGRVDGHDFLVALLNRLVMEYLAFTGEIAPFLNVVNWDLAHDVASEFPFVCAVKTARTWSNLRATWLCAVFRVAHAAQCH